MGSEKEFVEKALETAIPEVVESLKKQLIGSLDYEIREAAKRQIVEHVTGWIQENLIPVLGSHLMNMKEVFEKQSIEFCEQLAKSILEGLSKNFQAKMENSWTRETIVKSLFG